MNIIILHFIVTNHQSRYNGTCPMLLFQFHALGNQAMFLMENTMTREEVVQMCHSVLSSLEFLHREIQTMKDTKSGIAHGDLKSHHIVVRSQVPCCIRDLGLAVRHDGAGGVDHIPNM